MSSPEQARPEPPESLPPTLSDAGTEVPPASGSERCLNCGATLGGPYCAQCGQRHHAGAPTLRHVLADFADDYLHLDSKLPRSIAALCARPGFLTAEYVAGRRSRFVGPFKLYVLFSVVFFFCQTVIVSRRAPDALPDAAHDKPIDLKALDAKGNGGIGGRIFDRLLARQIDHKRPSEVVRMLRRSLTTYLPDGMLVLLPFVALILKLLHRRRYYAEHFVFSLHVHAMGFLVFTAGMLAERSSIFLALLIGFVAYGIVALRRVYRTGWLRSIADAAVLGVIYPFALAPLVLITVVVGTWLTA